MAPLFGHSYPQRATDRIGREPLENTKMDNTLVWADIPTRDLDRAMDFYSALLDVQVTPIQEEEMRFAMLRHDGSNAAACLGPMDKYHQPGGACPLIYLSLGDRLQEAEQLVPRLGGRVLEPLHSIGSGHGSRVIIEDTEGNWLALYAPPAP